MIKAKFYFNDNGVFGMEVDGHAGYAEKGKDIVCASASILTQTLIATIESCNESKAFSSKPKLKVEDGHAVIRCRPKDYWMESVNNMLATIEVGFKLLAQEYPQCVEILT